ncbi:MAG: hypothetical protein WEB56_03445 [Roseovarius sp.]
MSYNPELDVEKEFPRHADLRRKFHCFCQETPDRVVIQDLAIRGGLLDLDGIPRRHGWRLPVCATVADLDGHELMGRRPIALGKDAANVLTHFGIAHAVAPHPSARIGRFDARAALIAKAVQSS